MYSALALVFVVVNVLAAFSCGETAFESFIQKYDKKYPSAAVREQKAEIFRKNLEIISLLNAHSSTATYDVNQFSDLSPEEFRSYKSGVPSLRSLPTRRGAPISALPPPTAKKNTTKLDWTEHVPSVVTPVKEQGQCGSCWAFSAIGAIEGAWALAGNPLVNLSESELIDCTHTSLGCGGGWPNWAMDDILRAPFSGRVEIEQNYPYTVPSQDCTFHNTTIGAKISSYKSFSRIDTAALTEEQLEDLLIQTGPLSVCINADSMQHYKSGIDKPTDCPIDHIDHCILLVGFGEHEGTKFWKLKNSWGKWGDKGYYKLFKGTDEFGGSCGIQTAVTAAVV